MADLGADLAQGFILSCLVPYSCALSLFFMISFKCLHIRVINIAKDVEIVQSGQYIFELMKSSAIPLRVSKSWLKEWAGNVRWEIALGGGREGKVFWELILLDN